MVVVFSQDGLCDRVDTCDPGSNFFDGSGVFRDTMLDTR